MALGLDQSPPGGPPGAGPPGAGAPPLSVPKSPIGGPGGPGPSPMLSPGGGAGNKAAAIQQVKAVMPALLHAASAFESGSKEQQALLRSVSALNPIFGKAEGSNMVPAGLATMAQATKQGPLSAAPPPGLTPSQKPPAGMELPPGIGGEEAA
jgi:hypothetical protein